MRLLKRAWVLVKISFLSVFGTTKGLSNIEAEWAFVTGETKEIEPKEKKPETPAQKPQP